jgi:hypothetical protein
VKPGLTRGFLRGLAWALVLYGSAIVVAVLLVRWARGW